MKDKKILVLTPRLPYPIVGGDKLRIYRICEKLKKEGYDLELVSFVENGEQEVQAKMHEKSSIFSKVTTVKLSKPRSYINTILGFFGSDPLQISYYKSKTMKNLVDEKLSLKDYDSVLVHLVRMAPYVIEHEDINKVLEMTDAISLNYKRNKEVGRFGLANIAYTLDEPRVREYEKECLEKFDTTVVVSSVDKEYLIENAGSSFDSKVKVVSNGVSKEFLESDEFEPDPNLITFVGNLRSKQNQDSIFYFIDKVYPLIRKENPKAKLKVVGAHPPTKLKRLDSKDSIEVTGRVGSVVNSLKGARVSVAPIRIGAGIQNKILESMALYIPVVTNTIGSEGIEEAKDGTHFMVSDDPENFAKDVLKVMRDDDLYKKLRHNGRKLVENDYIFDEMLDPYPKFFD